MSASLQTSASSEKQIRAARERAKKDAEVEGTIIRVLMANPEGRRWIWNQLAYCRCFVVDENLKAKRMAFEKGLRSYGMKLFSAVGRYAPDAYLTMTKENSSVQFKEDPDGGNADDSNPDD